MPNTKIDLQALEQLIRSKTIVPDNRRYWLIRTQGGSYYESFRENNFIAINYDEIKLSEIAKIKKNAKDEIEAITGIKDMVGRTYKDLQNGLIASQLHKFVYEVKKDDVVIILGYSSGEVSFGTVKQTPLLEVSQRELVATGCPYEKRKGIRWKQSQSRISLDPYLYKMLQAHQVINDISHYGDIIERTLGNFYVKNGEGNLILDVLTPSKINARDLFSTGHFLLEYSQDFFNAYGIALDVNEVQVKINVNSKGKIHFKAPNASTVWLIALLIVGIVGGGASVKTSFFEMDISTDGAVKKVIEYQNSAQDRDIKQKLVQNMDSLQIQPPDDAIKMLKQFSTNKDLPK